MTAGFVHTALKFSFSVIQDMAGGILLHDFWCSRQQTLSRPAVVMAMQFPQMHINLGLNCVKIILKRTMNLD